MHVLLVDSLDEIELFIQTNVHDCDAGPKTLQNHNVIFYRSGLLERMPLMERIRNGNGEAITNGDTGIDGEDDLVDTEEMDRPKQIKKAEVLHSIFF